MNRCAVSKSAQFRTQCAGSPAPRALSDCPGAVCLVSSADRCSVSSVQACAHRPGSCTACNAACDVQAVRVRCGAGVSTGGVYSRRPAPPGQSFNHRKNKKGSPTFTKRHLSGCASLQKFQKIKKDPSPGLICAILDRKKGAL